MNIRFGDEVAFVLLLLLSILAPVIVFYGNHMRRRALARLGDHEVLRHSLLELSVVRRRVRTSFLLVACFLLAAAAARPQWGSTTELLKRRGLDIVFALDISRSMLARDLMPDRLERSKLEIAALVDPLSEHRIGLVAFAGSAFVQTPLTTDASAVKMFLHALTPQAIEQGGTAIAKALAVSARLFESSLAKGDAETSHPAQVLVLITDGEDHAGEIEAAAKQVRDKGIHLFAVGVGSEPGEPVPVVDDKGNVTGYLKDKAGKPVLSRLDPKTLQLLADAAGGLAFSGSRIDQSLQKVQVEIEKLERSEFESRLVVHHQERFQWPLAAAVLFLMAALVLPERSRAMGGRT